MRHLVYIDIEVKQMADKEEIEYWITKLLVYQLRSLLISIQNEIDGKMKYQEFKDKWNEKYGGA